MEKYSKEKVLENLYIVNSNVRGLDETIQDTAQDRLRLIIGVDKNIGKFLDYGSGEDIKLYINKKGGYIALSQETKEKIDSFNDQARINLIDSFTIFEEYKLKNDSGNEIRNLLDNTRIVTKNYDLLRTIFDKESEIGAELGVSRDMGKFVDDTNGNTFAIELLRRKGESIFYFHNIEELQFDNQKASLNFENTLYMFLRHFLKQA